MTDVGVNNEIYQLRKQIQQLTSELKSLGNSPEHMPELVEYANLLRSNEFLTESDSKKSQMIAAYEQYVKALEKMLSDVFEIQKGLKDILEEQSRLLDKPKRKTSKK